MYISLLLWRLMYIVHWMDYVHVAEVRKICGRGGPTSNGPPGSTAATPPHRPHKNFRLQ